MGLGWTLYSLLPELSVEHFSYFSESSYKIDMSTVHTPLLPCHLRNKTAHGSLHLHRLAHLGGRMVQGYTGEGCCLDMNDGIIR